MKRTMNVPALLAGMVLVLAALAQTAVGQTRDERAILAASHAWQRYVAAQNVDSIVALHTPYAVALFANAPIMRGPAQIRSGWSEIVKLPAFKVQWTPSWIDVASPRVANEYGTYTESYDTPAGKAHDEGNYVVIWHKVKGKWRVALDAPVSTVPIPEPAPVTQPVDPPTMEMHSANRLVWGDLTAPGFAPGARIAVLHGNPGGPGGVILRLQFPDGYQLPVHWHPNGENFTVLSGRLSLGMGNAFDAAALRDYWPGDYAYLPPHQSHFGQVHGTTIVQVNGRGPFVINPGTAN